MCGGGTMYPTTMNFAKVNEVPIVIIYTKFGEDRSISLVSAGSRISPLCLHLTTSHYNIACTTVQLVMLIKIKGIAVSVVAKINQLDLTS